MNDRIIDLPQWIQSPAGQYALDWEKKQLNEVVVDIFGYHALQLGLAQLDALQANRMPHRWLALPDPVSGQYAARPADLYCDFAALPFPANSLDLVVLPHTLEWSAEPQMTLREVERVLVPEGKAIISIINPVSLWGARMALQPQLQPADTHLLGFWRLRDWLRLLGFEVEVSRFGCYRPLVWGAHWLPRWQWLDRWGSRCWPVLGAVYFVVAVKRVRGMRLLGHTWKAKPILSPSGVSVARKG